MTFKAPNFGIPSSCGGAFAKRISTAFGLFFTGLCLSSSVLHADVTVGEPQQIQEKVELGTNPARMSRTLEIKDEYLWLNNGVRSNVFRLGYTMPFGQNLDWSLKITLPVASLYGVPGNPSSAGDVGFKVTHVFSVAETHAWAGSAEVLINSADQGLGYGQNAMKLQAFYVRFLKDGSIFAPTLVQTFGLENNPDVADLNLTTADFYYVPKLADPKTLLTLDPSLTHDWANDRTYAGLAVTAGRVVGKTFGGTSIVFVKPSMLFGNDRPGDWGVEVGFKVVGF
jgi:hypothetical protein